MKVTCILPFVALWSSFVAGFSSCHSRSGMVRVIGLPLLRSDNQAYHHFQHRSSSVNHNGNWPWTLMKGTTCSRFFMIPNMDSSSSRTLIPRGGSSGNDGSSSRRNNKKKTKSNMSSGTTDDTGTKYPATGGVSVISSLWGTGGVLYILSKALQRIIPVALEPFKEGALRPLSQLELGAYIATCLFFAYSEGYKGFQQKFGPLVVKRSFTLIPGRNGTRWYHFFLAPFYSMGMMHATRGRQVLSWSITLSVAALVAGVKRLPYPWRNIVDAGVVCGLTYGSLSILLIYVKSWITGQPPSNIDAELPESTNQES